MNETTKTSTSEAPSTTSPLTLPSKPTATRMPSPKFGPKPPPTAPRVCVIGNNLMSKRVVSLLSAPQLGIEIIPPATSLPNEQSLPDCFLDGVWICTEPEKRSSLVLQSAKKGVRTIYSESPIASTLSGVLECYDTCKEGDSELLCGWTQRFDSECKILHQQTREKRIASIHIKHHEGSQQATTSFASSPLTCQSVISNFLAEDFNVAAFLMDEQLPISVQATCRDVFGSGGVDAAVAHLEYSGGSSVLVEVSLNKRSSKYENSVSLILNGTTNSMSAGKRSGSSYTSKIERFENAIKSQIELFTAIVRGEAVQRVCRPEYCRITARMVAMAIESASTGRKITAGPAMRMLQIGSGVFGFRVSEKVLPRLQTCEVIGVITAANSELELDSILGRKDVDSVYICTPYAHTSSLVKRVIKFKNKKILSETPLPKLRDIQLIALEEDQFLMLAYHRRFDAEYRRAKAAIDDAGVFTSLFVESRDIKPHSTDAIDTLYRDVVHDLDTVVWLLTDIDCELSIKGIKVHGPASSISITIGVWLRKFDKTVDAHIDYSRGSPVYRQHISVDGHTFGYELRDIPTHEEAFAKIYDDAYVRMFQSFAAQIPCVGQGKHCLTYTKTHELLMATIEKAMDEHELKEKPKHVPQQRRGITSGSPSKRSQQAQQQSQQASTSGTQTQPIQQIQQPKPKLTLTIPENTTITIATAHSPKQPNVFEEFKYAVASHGGLFVSGAQLFKPLLYDGDENAVYSAVKEREPQLVRFLPEIFDQVTINDVPYIVMKNLVHGYSKPRVLNVKVGESSDFQKMCYQPYGIRFAGYTGDKMIRRSVPQSWNDMIGYFKDYIKDRDVNTSRYDNIPFWLKTLRDLQIALSSQRSFRFRAASLLFVYDCVDDAPQKPTVHLIDMARTSALPQGNPKPDHFICFGVRNLIKILVDIHQKFVNRHAVFLVRHGYRIDYGDLTWAPQSQYPHDPPLSVEGMRQAHDLAKRLKYENLEAIVSSPFSRAVQTAKVIAEELKVKYMVEPAFAEFMSVTNRRNVPDLDPQFSRDDALMDPTYRRVGEKLRLENWDSMCDRVHEALWRLSTLHKRIAIVSHRSTFQALLSVILGDKFKKQLQFASITSLLPSPTEIGWKVDRINSYSHLSAVLHSPEHNPNYTAGTLAYKDMIVGTDGKILPSGWN